MALSQAVRIVSQLVSITVLTRLLAPSDYGIMAMAGVFTNFAGLFRDFGTGSALIQKSQLSEEICNSVFWLNFAFGSLIFVVLLCTAPLAAAYYNQHQLQTVLSSLALIFPITCLTIVPGALFERASRFKTLAAIESGASVISLGIALIGATHGWGIYSLVAQALTFTILQSSALLLKSRWRPSRRPTISGLKEIFGFSANVSGFQIVNYFARNADSFIIGKVLGAALLGVYSVAYRLMLFPVQNMSYVASRALYPLMSRDHAEGKSVASGYFKYVGAIAFISAPAMAVLFVLREPLIHLIFGDKWKDVPELLTWLAPTGFIQSILSTSGSALMASGNARLMLICGLIGSVLQVGAFLIGVQYGLTGLVIAYFIANLLNAVFTFSRLLPVIDAKTTNLLRAIIFPIIAGTLTSVACIFLNESIAKSTTMSLISRILIVASIFCLIYFAAASVFARPQVKMMLAFLPLPWKSRFEPSSAPKR